MWKENNDKIQRYLKSSDKKTVARNILDYSVKGKPPAKKSSADERLSIAARFTDHGPTAQRPAKKSYSDIPQGKSQCRILNIERRNISQFFDVFSQMLIKLQICCWFRIKNVKTLYAKIDIRTNNKRLQ